MGRQWYGSINNRIEENRQFCETIEVGTGMTEYSWSDRHAYEVIEVTDQKHVKVREYDHKSKSHEPYTNDWELISNENNYTMDLVKRGKYWYTMVTITPEEAKEILEGNDIDAKIWACHNNFDLQDIVAKGKKKTTYHRKNVSFGVADYYYDYEF
jgi:hypothetical protein